MTQRLLEKLEDPRAVRGLRAQIDELHRRLARGERRLGWKIALNSPDVQQRLGLAGPLLGYLTDATEHPVAEAVPLAEGRVYLLEAEVALTLGSDVAAGSAERECASAISAVAPAIEILDLTRGPADLELILARNVFHGGVVFGEERPFSPEVTTDRLELELSVSRQTTISLDPGLVIGEPGAIVRFTAGILEQLGEHLRAKDRILCGSLNPATRVRPGDSVRAEIRPVGSLTVELGRSGNRPERPSSRR